MEAEGLSDLHTGRLTYKPPTHTHTCMHRHKGVWVTINQKNPHELLPLPLNAVTSFIIWSSSSFKDMSGEGKGSNSGSHWGHFLCSPPLNPFKNYVCPLLILPSSPFTSCSCSVHVPHQVGQLWGQQLSHSFVHFKRDGVAGGVKS